MKYKTKVIALVLAMLVITAGCSSGEKTTTDSSVGDPSQASSNTDAAPEVKDVKMLTFTYMDMPDYADVEEKTNEIMNPLGVNVVMEWTTASSYDDELKMKIAGGETVDICPLKDSLYAGMAGNGSLTKLDDYIDKAPDLVAAFEDGYSWLLNATKLDGSTYAIPVLDNKFSQNVLRLQTAVLDKYDIDLSAVKTYKDMTPIFALVHEKEPNMEIIIKDTMSPSRLAAGMFNGYDDFEGLGDSIGGLFGENNWDIVNVYASDEYMEYCTVMNEWFKAGYISPDIATSSDTFNTYWQTGNAFACFAGTTDLSPEQSEAWAKTTTGIDTTFISMGTQKANFLKFLQIVPITSKNPEGALIFLNEMYKNTDLVNTLYYGREGVDWNLNADGMIEGVEGSSYNKNSQLSFMFGNYYISSDIASQYKGFVKDCAEAMKNCESNRSLGFFFDTSAVTTQYTAVQNVVSEYRDGLDYGVLDPQEEIPNFVAKLEAAGINDIIKEKQSQLDQWVKDNNK